MTIANRDMFITDVMTQTIVARQSLDAALKYSAKMISSTVDNELNAAMQITLSSVFSNAAIAASDKKQRLDGELAKHMIDNMFDLLTKAKTTSAQEAIAQDIQSATDFATGVEDIDEHAFGRLGRYMNNSHSMKNTKPAATKVLVEIAETGMRPGCSQKIMSHATHALAGFSELNLKHS